MKRQTFSTGQAAKDCGVTPDTVLKWIKRNKIKAQRTAGGHFRIAPSELRRFVCDSEAIRPCWELPTKKNKGNCESCIVFLSKTEKCYALVGFLRKNKIRGCSQKGDCVNCEFAKQVERKRTV